MSTRNDILAVVLNDVDEWEKQDLLDYVREMMATWDKTQLRLFAKSQQIELPKHMWEDAK